MDNIYDIKLRYYSFIKKGDLQIIRKFQIASYIAG